MSKTVPTQKVKQIIYSKDLVLNCTELGPFSLILKQVVFAKSVFAAR